MPGPKAFPPSPVPLPLLRGGFFLYSMEAAKYAKEKLKSEQRTALMLVDGACLNLRKSSRNSAEPHTPRCRSHGADLHRLSTGDRKRIGIEE